jgi:hypothetical protein
LLKKYTQEAVPDGKRSIFQAFLLISVAEKPLKTI